MNDDTPPLNRMVQEAVDLAGTPAERSMVLEALMMLVAERLTEIAGPERAAHVLTRTARQIAGGQTVMPERQI